MGAGWSRVLCRTPGSEQLIEEMAREGAIEVRRSGPEEVYQSNRKIIAYKKRTITVRKNGMDHFPEYSVAFPQVHGGTKWKARFFLLCLRFGNTRFARRMLEIMSARFLDIVSSLMRKGTIQGRVRYGFWDVVTTLLSFFSYWGLLKTGLDYWIANIISMILTKSTAYVSNKYFVFHSRQKTQKALAGEVTRFVLTRTLSGVIDFFGLIFLVDICHAGELPGKACMIVIVTITNYVFGKWAVYKH